MEHLVRVQNERDRRTLAWLREQVGDAAIAEVVRSCGGLSKPYLSLVCTRLGLTAPRFNPTRRPTPSAVGEQSLVTIRQILACHNSTPSTLARSELR
ncbi:MAG TPA: hypothetical protein VGZ01_06700 [Trinickia sp.]|jgi:hypothetical protein|nr:hypothetical protein [Trinickia sp.]